MKDRISKFLKNTIKLPAYIEMIADSMSNAHAYIEPEVNIQEVIEKELINIIRKEIHTIRVKDYLSNYESKIDPIMDEDIENCLIDIKKKLFKRSKEIASVGGKRKLIK